MEVEPHDTLRINRILLTILGLWPYQSGFNKIFWFAFSVFFLITQGILQTGGMIAAWCDPPIFMESIPPVLISIMCVIKFINFIYNGNKMKLLLDILKRDWMESKDEGESKILSHWARDSRKNTIFYAIAVYGSMVPFMLGPIMPFIEKLIPESIMPSSANSSTTKAIMFHVEYLVDIEKYYLSLVINSYFGTIIYITVVVAIDSMFMVYVQHACAIFQIIGYRLEHLVDNHNLDIDINININQDKPYHRLRECIKKHTEALKYAQIIEAANSISFMLQLGLNMICISFTGFQAVTKLNYIDEAMRYASFTVAQTFHLFFESWPSQRLIDESIKICEYTTTSVWYLTSLRSRKLLQLLLMRSLEPCQLTAGNFYNLNLENFSAVVKTSMSYLTVLRSTQEDIQ